MIHLYNTLTRAKEPLTPLDQANVRMYVCGPTVYDRPHLGNARSVVVYDVLYRLLMHVYGKEHVTYARNITDVDDKINARAKEMGVPISQLTAEVTKQFHADMKALNCLQPNEEPRATAHIQVMIGIIEQLLEHKHAYVKDNHVLFDVPSYKDYGKLSGRVQEELVAGARVEVEAYKKNPSDFVLWKPADEGDDPSSVFDSPWGKGRPGWHIECSAMSMTYLGETFDIHGGGADLMFPHHENEIAQSICATPGSEFAKMWVHNGFLTVNGEKMSKSLGNFITVRDLLDKGVKGEVIRLALLSAHYRKPLDWNEKLVHDAKALLDTAYRALSRANKIAADESIADKNKVKEFEPTQALTNSLSNDLNTPIAISLIPTYASMINTWLDLPETSAENKAAVKVIAARFKEAMQLLGILQRDPDEWFGRGEDAGIQAQIDARNAAKKSKDFATADRIRKELETQGILLEDKPGGVTEWRRA